MNTAKSNIINFNDKQNYINQINNRFELFEIESTYTDYTREIKKFFGISNMYELTYSMIKSVKSEDIVTYLKTYTDNNRSESYLNKIKSSISKLYFHAIEFSEENEEEIGYKLFSFNPANTSSVVLFIKKNCNKNHSPKLPIVTRDMIYEYVDAIKEHTDPLKPKVKIKNSILIYLMFACGCRRAEAIDLQMKNLFIENGIHHIRIDSGKGNKSREVDIPEDLYNMIIEYADSYGLDENSYIIGKGVYNEKVSEGFVNKTIAKYNKYVTTVINPHGFRHGFALELLNNGVEIKNIADLMGHESEKTTNVYFSKMIKQKRNIIQI